MSDPIIRERKYRKYGSLKGGQPRGHAPMKRRLTELEKGALRLLLEGKSNKEIATEVGTDEQCIKNRLYKAFRKLGIKSTRELLPIAEKTKDSLNMV